MDIKPFLDWFKSFHSKHPRLAGCSIIAAAAYWATIETIVLIGMPEILLLAVLWFMITLLMSTILVAALIGNQAADLFDGIEILGRCIDRSKQRGIYIISCPRDDATYLGSTEINFHVRWGQHITSLDRGEHHNPRLQEAWRDYGPDAFQFCVAEVIDDIEDIRPRETELLEWRAMNLPPKQNYNVNNSRMRRDVSMPELQFVYPVRTIQKIVRAPAKRKFVKRIKPKVDES